MQMNQTLTCTEKDANEKLPSTWYLLIT